jgi:hypothetical protein
MGHSLRKAKGGNRPLSLGDGNLIADDPKERPSQPQSPRHRRPSFFETPI